MRGGARVQRAVGLARDEQAQRRGRDAAAPRVAGDPEAHLAVAVDVNAAAVPAKPPFSVTTKDETSAAAALAGDPRVERVAVVGILRRERGHRDGLAVAHHLEDRVEVVVIEVPQLDVAPTRHAP